MWTETLFLNNMKCNAAKDRPQPPVRSETGDSSALVESPPQKKRKRSSSDVEERPITKSTKKYKIRNASKNSEKTIYSPSSSSSDGSTDSTSQVVAEESIVWDIESIGKDDTGESVLSTKKETTRITKWSGEAPVIIDQCTPNSGGRREEIRPFLPPLGGEKQALDLSSDNSASCSSLCPSQSVSHAILAPPNPHGAQKPIRSKYFKNTVPIDTVDDRDKIETPVLENQNIEVEAQEYKLTVDEEEPLRCSSGALTPNNFVYAQAAHSLLEEVCNPPVNGPGVVQDVDDISYYDESIVDGVSPYTPLLSAVGDRSNLDYGPMDDIYEASFYYGSSCDDIYEFEDASDGMAFENDSDWNLPDGLFDEPALTWVDSGHWGGDNFDRNYADLYNSPDYLPAQPLAYEDLPFSSGAVLTPDDIAEASTSTIECNEADSFEQSSCSAVDWFPHGQVHLGGYSPAPAGSVDVVPTGLDVATGHLELPTLAQVEEGVAKTLQGHWRPQKL
ncbi:hypothetical protein BDY19DRAFT_570948 [Irpex rosettiformis]|uniref:Uncharacterized protein n=1 Tax=Irpex rosettiformis TaxID=378272 RepID=A0ACB8UD39_9APHY|nr:hypothetical protein BDY19DRAFT_570948 [Irpex rosettiformis]